MAKQRYINTHFWDDSYVVELDPIEKLLFLYFLTNPLTNIAGAYEVSIRRVAFDTGIDKEMIVKILGRFEKANKIIYRDGWILICNFIKNQSFNPKMLKGVEDALSQCPDWIKHTLSIAYQSLSHLNRDLNRDSNRDSNRENSVSVETVTATVKSPKVPAKPKEEVHAAIQAIRTVTGKYPDKILWKPIIQVVGEEPDVGRLEQCYVVWRSKGYSPSNFAWALEWYKNGIPEQHLGANQNGTSQNTNGSYGNGNNGKTASIANHRSDAEVLAGLGIGS